jgi:hypothetical protein
LVEIQISFKEPVMNAKESAAISAIADSLSNYCPERSEEFCFIILDACNRLRRLSAEPTDKPQPKIPRQYSLVKCVHNFLPAALDEHEQVFIFYGEIPNMPGHCVVSGHTDGRIYSGYHTGNFVQIPDEET